MEFQDLINKDKDARDVNNFKGGGKGETITIKR